MNNQVFSIEIVTDRQLNELLQDKQLYEYDDELDSMISVFNDLSKAFYERGIYMLLKVEYEVWNTHSVELCIFLESFIGLYSFIKQENQEKYFLDFYEQGARYSFYFEKEKPGYYTLQFINRDVPNSERTVLNNSLYDLELVLTTFYTRVSYLAHFICPSISKNKMYKVWNSELIKYKV